MSSFKMLHLSATDWEGLWSPYDQPTYQAVLDFIEPNDVVMDIGAGDLRLAYQIIQQAKKVYAIEINPRVIKLGQKHRFHDTQRLVAICADARQFEIPDDVSVGVLLMRHCLHFRLYAEKLKQAGVNRLVTNARWRMGVECVRLQVERLRYISLSMGWYACWCGATGFKTGPAETCTEETISRVHEVIDCPLCPS